MTINWTTDKMKIVDIYIYQVLRVYFKRFTSPGAYARAKKRALVRAI